MKAGIGARAGALTGSESLSHERFLVSRSSAEETAALRQAVLRPNLTVAQMAIAGDQNPKTTYLAVRDPAGNGVVLGCLRLEPVPCPWPEVVEVASQTNWQLRAMATDPSVRGTGLGALLVQAAVGYVEAGGGELIWCNARIGAEGFYAKLGFRTVTDPFVVPGVPSGEHVGMVRGVQRVTDGRATDRGSAWEEQ